MADQEKAARSRTASVIGAGRQRRSAQAVQGLQVRSQLAQGQALQLARTDFEHATGHPQRDAAAYAADAQPG